MGQNPFKCNTESRITESCLSSVIMGGNIHYLPPPQGPSDGHNHREKTGHLQKSGTVADATMDVRDSLGLKDLTAEQLQHILSIVEATCCHGPAETHNTKGKSPNVHW